MNRATIFAVITVSDSCFNKSAENLSGPCLESLLLETFPPIKIYSEIIPDDKLIIERALSKYADIIEAKAVFTTGGTGFSPRDVTPEATRSVIQRECPQLALAMALKSFETTPFAALSRAVCGIRNRTLIINLPGSVKAVRECFDAIKIVIPHAIQLITDDLKLVREVHEQIQIPQSGHVCPHKTGVGDQNDRSSPYPMLPIQAALEIILQTINPMKSEGNYANFIQNFKSPVNIPPFRASIKDGYALKSSGFSGTKKVVGYIAAGSEINNYELEDDECFKINTGAPVPAKADCIIQVEDTKLLKLKKNGEEELIEILVEPKPLLDIRPIGCDLKEGSKLFPFVDLSDVVTQSLLASVGHRMDFKKARIGIISTGNELLHPESANIPHMIYDSNTTMLKELIKYFGFQCIAEEVVTDKLDAVTHSISNMLKNVDYIICTGGVSMGDKDYIKPALQDIGFKIHFGRVNMKPGKPMTFASKDEKYFFGLPGNPVSAFVTFHLFVLPALRCGSGWTRDKCELAKVQVKLGNAQLKLDPRPEYVRASVTSRNGELYAHSTGDQLSSRLQSIVGADVLIHLPHRSENRTYVQKGEIFTASILRYDFISKYE